MVADGTPFTHKASGYTIQYPAGWRWIKMPFGDETVATRDGIWLQQIFVDFRKHKNAFRALKQDSTPEMMPQELAEKYVAEMAAASSLQNMEILSNEPALLAGRPAFRVHVAYRASVDMGSVRYEAIIVGANSPQESSWSATTRPCCTISSATSTPSRRRSPPLRSRTRRRSADAPPAPRVRPSPLVPEPQHQPVQRELHGVVAAVHQEQRERLALEQVIDAEAGGDPAETGREARGGGVVDRGEGPRNIANTAAAIKDSTNEPPNTTAGWPFCSWSSVRPLARCQAPRNIAFEYQILRARMRTRPRRSRPAS